MVLLHFSDMLCPVYFFVFEFVPKNIGRLKVELTEIPLALAGLHFGIFFIISIAIESSLELTPLRMRGHLIFPFSSIIKVVKTFPLIESVGQFGGYFIFSFTIVRLKPNSPLTHL